MNNLNDIFNIEQFNNLEFIAKQVVEGFITGLHKSPFHGFSVEFAEHRIYNTGESTRHIDWKLFARSEKLFVKRYEEETNLRCQIVVDTSSSMLFPFNEVGKPNKLVFSIYCAAALINLLRKQRDAAGITTFSDKIELHTDSKLSATHSKMLYAELEKMLNFGNTTSVVNKKTTASQLLHQIAENIHKRSMVIIFSDLLETENQDDIFSALQHLRYNKHEVILFHVIDSVHERDFQFQNRPYKFIDLESNEEVRFNPNDVKDIYTTKMAEFLNKIKIRTGQFGIDLITADINSSFRNVLLPYLIKRSKLY